MSAVGNHIKKLEKALESSNKRNRDLEARNKELVHKNRILREELDFVKSMVLKNKK